MEEKDKDTLRSNILKNIEQLQKYLARTEIDSLEPAYQLIRKQKKIMYDMLVFIHLTEPITLEKPIEHSHKGTFTPNKYNTFTGDNPLYRDSVGTEGLHEDTR